MKTAAYISTDDFNEIIKLLKQNQWKVTAEYLNIAYKGIDFDFYVLTRKNEEILMAWDNWTEGSVKAEEKYLSALEKELEKPFRYEKVAYFEEDLPRIRKRLFKYFWREKLTVINFIKITASIIFLLLVVYSFIHPFLK